ncbi:MAG TPA: ATP-binding protein [Bacillota bacterium]|jgi:anti-sigma regulatory factor (Ser/Thr protein kinase)
MRELALHLLDLLQNSAEAGADQVDLSIEEDPARDALRLVVTDNGRGMDAETRRRVLDPFFTTRKTRPVGLGLPLFEAAARRCNGGLEIESAPGAGTTVTATFQRSNIDRAPLGDLPTTLAVFLAGHAGLDLRYRHRLGDRGFVFDSRAVHERLGEVGFDHPLVADWVKGHLSEALANLQKG